MKGGGLREKYVGGEYRRVKQEICVMEKSSAWQQSVGKNDSSYIVRL